MDIDFTSDKITFVLMFRLGTGAVCLDWSKHCVPWLTKVDLILIWKRQSGGQYHDPNLDTTLYGGIGI